MKHLAKLALVLATVAACGGARPAGPDLGGARQADASPAAATDAISATAAASAPLAEATPTPEPTVAAASPTPTPKPTPAAHSTPAPTGGSLTVELTSPVKLDYTVPAKVTCTVGGQYEMVTGVERSTDSVDVSVEIAFYHGPGSYHAAVTLQVSTSSSPTQGGTIPGVPVTIVSDDKGVATFNYSSGGETLAGSIGWTCS
jgi:hypothetical protein